ncbi:pentapeptide repeat-containing protein [Marinovum sp. 2_MG-2023]|uniref:pentapeptide repeat-containing protein n=1 Tax=unclassified Marinovum TaxID=2647166 RepID=UPI0026E21E20|nr:MULTISPECIES: pentapeptide repeat-containing protein [unclassified Marinovum]MDO6731941.1 pentapeptide repeat-containing protein [Marinovum sp. 2_MG-2023]MDO6781193.1 pentapeptide repeat-containing protein [Marinovum sp. 1_MG-2023]
MESYLFFVTHPLLWGFLGLTLVFYLIQSLVARQPDEDRKKRPYLDTIKNPALRALALFALVLSPVWVLLLLAVLWSLLGIVLTLPAFEASKDTELRWHVLAMVGLITAFGGIIGAPLALIRVFTTERQTKTSEEGLITDRINKAVEGLGSEKGSNRIGRPVTIYTGEKSGVTVIGKKRADIEVPEFSLVGKEYWDEWWNEHTAETSRERHVPVSTWSEARTEIEWQGHALTIAEGEAIGEEGKWQVFTETLPNLEVRIGAIYALERIAKDSGSDHVQIMEILCAYIRQNAPASEAKPWPELKMKEGEIDGLLEGDWKARLMAYRAAQETAKKNLTMREDIQVALTVIGRRSTRQRELEAKANNNDTGFVFDNFLPDIGFINMDFDSETQRTQARMVQSWTRKLLDYRGFLLDLGNCNLRGAYLVEGNFAGASFINSELQAANFDGANLRGANLFAVNSEEALFRRAHLQGANLSAANLNRADFQEAFLQGADMSDARMSDAFLVLANIQSANLSGAFLQSAILRSVAAWGAQLATCRLQHAQLQGARLQGANLGSARVQSANFSHADLHDASLQHLKTSADTLFPEGLKHPIH